MRNTKPSGGRLDAALRKIPKIVSKRRYGYIIGALGVVLGMLTTLYLPLLLWGDHIWLVSTSTDGWNNWVSAEVSSLGGFSGYVHIFQITHTIETIPGWTLLISAPAVLSWHLHLVFPQYGYPMQYPSAWWVAGPTYMMVILVVTVAADAVLDKMGRITKLNRVVVLLGVASLSFVAVLWGHPEDIMSLAFSLMAVKTAHDGRYRAAAWWVSVALSMQLLAVLVVPLILVTFPYKRWGSMAWRMLLVPVILMLPLMIGAPGATLHAMLGQKIYKAAGMYSPMWNLASLGFIWRDLVFVGAIVVAIVYKRYMAHTMANMLWLWGMVVFLRIFEAEFIVYFVVPAMALMLLASAGRMRWYQTAALLVATAWTTKMLWIPIHGSWGHWGTLLGYEVLLIALARIGVQRSKVEEQVRPPEPAELVEA